MRIRRNIMMIKKTLTVMLSRRRRKRMMRSPQVVTRRMTQPDMCMLELHVKKKTSVWMHKRPHTICVNKVGSNQILSSLSCTPRK